MNLFKLKKDGKTVGYLKIVDGRVLLNPIDRPGYWCTYDGHLCRDLFDEALPYVCDDKNGEKVFAGDKICRKNKPVGIIQYNDELLWYHVDGEPLFIQEFKLIKEPE